MAGSFCAGLFCGSSRIRVESLLSFWGAFFFAVADGHLLDYSGKVDDRLSSIPAGRLPGAASPLVLQGGQTSGGPRRRKACTP
ncbi:hypothetical protein [Paraburkholderia phytofirmans]|uniref:hypothetical protein n=1 Tax=Paraburkholderia phytofirmans TaxID=261302 RepID=UPI0000E7DB7B|nr:hypothetical protein [Paraburkholderia phytofirmans]